MMTFQCRNCCRNNAYPSHKRTVFERVVLPLFLLRPVRCGHCLRRQYVTMLCEVQDRRQHSQAKPRVAA
jgi:hypothetical protein